MRVLRDLRTEANLRQLDVATRLDRPQSFVAKYEAGERRLDLVELNEVAAALSSDLDEIIRRWRADDA